MNEIMSSNISIYFNNTYNFNEILRQNRMYFQNIYDQVQYSNYISNDIKYNLKDYPKYPTNFKYISGLGSFNVQKLQEVALDSVQYLLDHIPTTILSQKVNLDLIPIQRDNLIFDVSFQKTFIESNLDLYNYKKFFLTFYNFPEYDNLFYSLIGSTNLHSNLLSIDSFQQFTHLFYLTTNFQKFSDIKSNINDFMISNDSITPTLISSDFNNYIDCNFKNIKDSTANIVLKNVYSIVQTSENLLEKATVNLDNDINTLKTKFIYFLNNSISDPSKDIANLLFQIIAHNTSIYALTDINSKFKVLSEPFYSGYTPLEESYISGYLDKVNKSNAQPYLFLSYLYKFWGIKYINVLPLILKNYVEDLISPQITPDQFYPDPQQVPIGISKIINTVPIINSTVITGILGGYKNSGLNYSEYANLLDYELNPDKILVDFKKQNCSQFIVFIYFLELIDKFIASKEFNLFLENILNNIFTSLKDNGYVDYKYDWYKCLDGLKIYYKSLFRLGLTNNGLFPEVSSSITDSLTFILSSNNSIIEKEELAGRLDQKNINFSTKFKFIDSSVKIFIDNIEIDKSKYKTYGDFHSIVFLDIPITNNKILINYETNYKINKTISEDIIQSTFNTFYSNSSNVTKLTSFMKNFYLGCITKQVTFDILDYFLI